MTQIGTDAAPLRIAIIGSGPSGFYAAEHLFKQTSLVIEVDMYDRLPTPYGLVRGGVAPDHYKIKTVTKTYEKIASNPRFRFYGNVEFGRDIPHDELKLYYHAIIYAVGAQTDRAMRIPGEDLKGSFAATEFVGWYNAHPDYRDLQFDLSVSAVAVIGNGNVAMDVARILASSEAELRKTDIADYALEALTQSKVTDIYMIGRRGPAQAAFTNPELKEFGEMADADVIVSPEDATLDPLSLADLNQNPNSVAQKNIALLKKYSERPPSGKNKRIHMRFLLSPTALIGTEAVEAIKLVKNELYTADDGSLRPRPTDQAETLSVGLVFRSIGYKGVPLLGVPFDDKNAVIPNAAGRVLDPATKQPIPGEYAVGWIKRGPSGVIGTNKPDSVETVNKLLEDLPNLPQIDPHKAPRVAVEALLRACKPDYVTFEDWLRLDQIELERGASVGRPRIKFSRVPEMLSALQKRQS